MNERLPKSCGYCGFELDGDVKKKFGKLFHSECVQMERIRRSPDNPLIPRIEITGGRVLRTPISQEKGHY